MHLAKCLVRTAFVALAALWFTTGSALAYPVTLSLTNVVFDDGGTAFGNIWLNTYGYVERSNVVTTPGSTLAGQSFAYPPGAVAPNYLTDPGGNNWIVLFDNAYNQALWLEVETRPDQQQLTAPTASSVDVKQRPMRCIVRSNCSTRATSTPNTILTSPCRNRYRLPYSVRDCSGHILAGGRAAGPRPEPYPPIPSRFETIAAPSLIALSLAQTTSSATRPRPAEVSKPQSVPA